MLDAGITIEQVLARYEPAHSRPQARQDLPQDRPAQCAAGCRRRAPGRARVPEAREADPSQVKEIRVRIAKGETQYALRLEFGHSQMHRPLSMEPSTAICVHQAILARRLMSPLYSPVVGVSVAGEELGCDPAGLFEPITPVAHSRTAVTVASASVRSSGAAS